MVDRAFSGEVFLVIDVSRKCLDDVDGVSVERKGD